VNRKINIYMNEHIRNSRPTAPVIVVEQAGIGGRRVFANHVDIVDNDGQILATIKYAPNDNPSRTHRVKAWIEVPNRKNVRVL
jgi:hypothetical protein